MLDGRSLQHTPYTVLGYVTSYVIRSSLLIHIQGGTVLSGLYYNKVYKHKGFTLVGSISVLAEALSELKGLVRELILCMAILVLLSTFNRV